MASQNEVARVDSALAIATDGSPSAARDGADGGPKQQQTDGNQGSRERQTSPSSRRPTFNRSTIARLALEDRQFIGVSTTTHTRQLGAAVL
jgi:hypothetical protein